MTTTVVYQHPDLTDGDLAAFLTDAIRSPAMLQLEAKRTIDGLFFRGYRSNEPLDLLASWAGSYDIASSFGPRVRTAPRLAVVAIVIQDGWVEYVGRPA